MKRVGLSETSVISLFYYVLKDGTPGGGMWVYGLDWAGPG